RDKRKVDGFIDFSKQVILGNKVFYVDCFGLKFPGWVRPEHIKTFLRNCFIPNSTKKAVDPSLSTASGGTSVPPRRWANPRTNPRRFRDVAEILLRPCSDGAAIPRRIRRNRLPTGRRDPSSEGR